MRDGKPHFSTKTPIGTIIVNPAPIIANIIHNDKGNSNMRVNWPVYAATIEDYNGEVGAIFKGYTFVQTFDPNTVEVRQAYQILMDPDIFQVYNSDGTPLSLPRPHANFDPFSL